MKVVPLGGEFRVELTEETLLRMVLTIDELARENNAKDELLKTLFNKVEVLENRIPTIDRPF